MMRIGLTIGSLLLLWDFATCPPGKPPRTNRKAKPSGPVVQNVLREASEIALKQDQHQDYWSDRVLLHIANVQIRAGDFDGALKSIRGSSYPNDRNGGLVELAEALARNGKRERAFDVLRLLGADHGWRQDYLDDGVQLQWIEHLIASGDLGRAREATEQLKSQRYRPDGLRKLAVAFAESGDAVQAAEFSTLAVEAAVNVSDDFDRARALWETADAQLTVGTVEAAKATIRRLAETIELKDPWATVAALRESAVLSAKANDEGTAHRLFRRAIDAQQKVDAMNKSGALNLIAVGQAEVGYIEDARQTASMIKHSDKDFTPDGRREEALLAIAIAQLKANDAEGALRTALSVEYYVQYRDDALYKIVDHHLAKRDLKTALTTAEKIGRPSTKATAILKVATAHARAGDRKTAAEVAARIELTHRDLIDEEERFDYRLPRTWCVLYEPSYTMGSYSSSVEHAAGVASAAMTLAQALGKQPAQSYAILFNDIRIEEVTQALARAHAASGDARAALAWAKQIGSSGKVNSNEDYEALWAVQRRIHAILGVAEGILDRSSEVLPELTR